MAMRAPYSVALLCLAASCGSGSCLRSRASVAEVPELASAESPEYVPLSQASRARRVQVLKTWLWVGAGEVFEHRRNLSGLLGDSELARGDDAKPKCVEADGLAAQRFLDEWSPRLMGGMQEVMDAMEPLIEKAAEGAVPDANGQVQIQFGTEDMKKIEKAMKKVKSDMMSKLPRSCRSLGNEGGTSWASVITCAHQAANVSKDCMRCLPRLTHQLEGECLGTCEDAAIGAAFDTMGTLPFTMGAMGGMGRSPLIKKKNLTEEDLDRAVQRSREEQEEGVNSMLKSFKKFVPCAKCLKHKVHGLFDCMSLPANWTKDLDDAMQQVVDDMQNAGSSDSAISTQPQPTAPAPKQPAVPLE